MATATVQAPSSARRVLVIDDEPAVLRVLGLLLERNGFRVDTVASARDALRLLEREKFDVVLSDIIMPELSGVDFLRELRRHAAFPAEAGGAGGAGEVGGARGGAGRASAPEAAGAHDDDARGAAVQ